MTFQQAGSFNETGHDYLYRQRQNPFDSTYQHEPDQDTMIVRSDPHQQRFFSP